MIDFTKIKPFVSNTFDTDRLIAIEGYSTGKMKFEGALPCHFVIRQIDAAPGSGTVGTHDLPVQATGEVYISDPIDVDDKDRVTVAKCDTRGNVLAVYQGLAGNIAIREARSTFNITLTKLSAPLPPDPPDYSLWYFDNGGRPAVATSVPIQCKETEYDGSPILALIDPGIVREDRTHCYFNDPEKGEVYIVPGSVFWRDGSTREEGFSNFGYPQVLETGEPFIYMDV